MKAILPYKNGGFSLFWWRKNNATIIVTSSAIGTANYTPVTPKTFGNVSKSFNGSQDHYRCSTDKSNTRSCTAHFICEEVMKQIVWAGYLTWPPFSLMISYHLRKWCISNALPLIRLHTGRFYSTYLINLRYIISQLIWMPANPSHQHFLSIFNRIIAPIKINSQIWSRMKKF